MSNISIVKHKFDPILSKKLNLLNKLDNWRGFLGVIEDYFIIGLAIFLYFYSPWFYPITIIIIGARQGALANLAHEAGHGHLVKNKSLNYILGTFFTGYLIFQEMKTFINSHVKSHHVFLGDQGKDPDYSYHISVGLYKNQSKKTFLDNYVIKPLYLATILHYMKNIFISRAPTFSKYKFEACVMTIYLLLITFLLNYFGWLRYLLLFWIIPYFTIFPTIGWFVDFVEHYPLVQDNNYDIQMTRNRFSHFIEHFIFNAHNENYHLTHHLRPDIPFWNLSKAHSIMMEDQTYNHLNQGMGGIFISKNKQASFIKKILNEDRVLFNNFFPKETHV